MKMVRCICQYSYYKQNKDLQIQACRDRKDAKRMFNYAVNTGTNDEM